MSRFLDNWLNAQRVSYAVFIAVAMGGLLIWTLATWPPPLASHSATGATVVSIADCGYGVVTLDDGTRLRLQFFRPFPRPGDRVPMLVETYEDGSRGYALDREAWIAGGPR
jgi:hypothetical protein